MYKGIKEEDVNYVILQDNGEPVVWSDNNLPVIYGGVGDAEMDLQEGDKIVNLGEYEKRIDENYKSLI